MLENPNNDIAIAVVGNKKDVEEREREVSFERGEMIAKSAGAFFGETSARTGEGVESIFIRVAKEGWEKKKLRDKNSTTSSTIGNIQDNRDGTKQGCCS